MAEMRHATPRPHDDIVYPSAVPFVLFHLASVAAILTGVTAEALWLGLGLYIVRIFAIGAGYHRYFSHRAYATSRAFQFVLAFLAQSSAQKSVLWWAAMHRHHHRHSDTVEDVHSPRHAGFLYAHLGWIFSRRHGDIDLVRVADLARYPELLWLHRYPLVPPALMGVAAFLLAGWPGLIVGFVWSTVLVYHATFAINSLAHVHGTKRYVTGDDSRNNWFLALLTMGEGWHNNHHAFQSSVRQGFRWWEIDPTYYILKLLSAFGLVWDLKSPPEPVLRNEHKLGSRVIERAATELAESFHADRIAAAARAALLRAIGSAEVRKVLSKPQDHADEPTVARILAHLPSRDAMVQRAAAMFARTRSLDEIVERANQILLSAVCSRLMVTAEE